jgi:serine phosphatase RsbU (regulator of sigma subunit)/predicted Ser/Thr protein kinase
VRLPGYDVEAEIARTATSVIYRAVSGGRTYAVKALHSAAASDPAAALRVRREAAAIARLDHPALVKVVEVGEHSSGTYLVMEFAEGRSLDRVLMDGPLGEEATVRIATDLADAVAEVHRQGLIHRDIKPANIVVTPAGGAVIIDFGFAVAPDAPDDGPGSVVGTLLYAPPEQTGMLKRPVDARADLYALGCVLFECLTGRPPFDASDVSTLLRLHASAAPPDVQALVGDVSPALAQIVGKLLRKDPDDRYASARQLRTDLERLPELRAAHAAGQPLTLGASAGARPVEIAPLIGREAEVAVLERLWLRAQAGQGGVLLVEGEPGAGKTRLIREITGRALEQGQLVLVGKCQQADAVPLGPLREAVDALLARLAQLPPSERERSLQVLREAAGEFGAVVRRLSRGLQRVFADALEVGQLDATSERERFYEKVSDFLLQLSRARGGLVLQIDDVQWIDEGTLEVVRRLASRAPVAPLLVATSARNDTASITARDTVISALGDGLSARVMLGPLTVEGVRALVRAYLGGKEVPPAVGERLAAATNGNPFAISQYVASMLDAGMLRLVRNRWDVDMGQLAALMVSPDVLNLIVARVRALSPNSIQILRVAAVIGLRFSEDVLMEAGRFTVGVAGALEEACRAHLVEALEAGWYAFVHDRLVEALVGDVPPDELRDIHQAINDALVPRQHGSPEVIFARALHATLGHAERDPLDVHRATHAAGLLALESYDNARAHSFLTRALAFGEKADVPERQLGGVIEALGVACWRVARQDEACAYFARALRVLTRDLDRARIHYLAAETRMSQSKLNLAWSEVEAGLSVLGTSYPRSPYVRTALALWHWVLVTVLTWTGLSFGAAKDEARERRILVRKLTEVGGNIHYFQGEPFGFLRMIVHQVYHAHFIGSSHDLAISHAYYCMFFSLLTMKRTAAKYRRLALEVAAQLGDRNLLHSCRITVEVLAPEWAGELALSRRSHPEILAAVRQYCAPFDLGRCALAPGFHLLFSGAFSESVELLQARKPDIDRSGSAMWQSNLHAALYAQLTVLGRHPEAMRAREEAVRKLAAVPGAVFAEVLLDVADLIALIDRQDFGAELEQTIDRFYETAYIRGATDYYGRIGYALIGHARIEQLERASGAERLRHRTLLSLAIRRGRRHLITPVHRCHLFVLRAVNARAAGRRRRAAQLLDRAELLATEGESRWGAFLVHKERARLARDRGEQDTARVHAQKALEVAEQNGWRNRADQIQAEFGRLGPDPAQSTRDPAALTVAATRLLFAKERYADALLRVALVATRTLDVREHARLALDELVRLLGAERALIFLCEDGRHPSQLCGRDAEERDISDAAGYSTTVVRRVAETRLPIVVAGTDQGGLLGSLSAVAHELRSIMAAPLMVQDELLGVVYLDSRVAKGLFSYDDVLILLAIGNHVAIGMQTARMAEREAQRRSLETDLALTAAVQSYFLPPRSAHRAGSWVIVGASKPAAQCGGDWWWYDFTGSRMRVVVADVAGHGPAPAMITAAVATSLRTVAPMRPAMSIDDIALFLDNQLRSLSPSQYSMSGIVLELAADTNMASWRSGGAPPVVIVRHDGSPEVIRSQSTPLGWEALALARGETTLAPGDQLVVFTDGLIDWELADGTTLGLRRLLSVLSKTATHRIADVPEIIFAELDRMRGKAAIADDVTFVIARRLDGASSP